MINHFIISNKYFLTGVQLACLGSSLVFVRKGW